MTEHGNYRIQNHTETTKKKPKTPHNPAIATMASTYGESPCTYLG